MKLVILDRDGTINEDREDFVKSEHEWVPLPGALEAIARLSQAGWRVVLATNQSGLGRGLFEMGTLNAMHAKMNRLLAKEGGRIDAVFFCPHAPDEGCDCRKPLPGLMHQIADRYGIELAETPVVGDSLRDIQAGAAAGCPTHLVRTGKAAVASQTELDHWMAQVPGTALHADLGAFVSHLLAQERAARAAAGEDASDYGRLDA